MSCNCGCHDDKPPATEWRKLVTVFVALAMGGALIAGAVIKKDDAGKSESCSPTERTTTEAKR